MRRSVILLSFLFLFCSCSIAFALSQAQTNGLNYLANTQNADGSWNENIVTDFYNSSTVLQTLKLYNQIDTSYNLGLQWIQQSSADNSDYLSKQIVLFAQNNIDYQNQLSKLLLWNNIGGGWGLDASYQSDILDTAFALQALKKINYSDQTVIQAAISYLLAHQNTDGGWGFDKGDASNVYMTAIVSRTLQQLSLTSAMATAVNKATSYIIAHQNADGGFGSSPSTVYETALAYIALVAVTSDNTVLGSASQYITNAQAANGSWNEDPYVTALALQALYYAENKPLPPAPTLASVTGTVIDASTNQVLKGAAVVLQNNTAINAISNASGVFILNNVPIGSQQIAISLAGYDTRTMAINATAGAIINLGSIPLSVNGSTGIVRGMVVDAATSQPLAGVTITISGAYSATATTGADGSFIFTGVTPGGITVAASFVGYYTGTGTGSVVAGGVLFFNPQLSTTPPTGTTGRLIGKIIDASTGSAIQGASVAVSGGATVSMDAQGAFAIDGVTAGTHTVTVTASGYTTQAYQVMISEGGTTDMGIIPLTAGAPGSTTIKGIVTDVGTGNPIALADVSVVGTSLTAKTASDGSYAISGIGQLSFNMRVSTTGYNSKIMSVSSAQYGLYTVNIALGQSTANGLKITSLSLDSASYMANSPMQINATLDNASDNAYGIYVYAEIRDVNNNSLDKRLLQYDPLNINPNSTNPVTMSWNAGRNIPGTYQLILSAVNSGNGVILAEESVAFSILPTISVSGVRLNITPQYVDFATTQTIKLSVNYNNRSNIEATLKAGYEVKDTSANVISNGEVNIPVNISDSMISADIGSLTYAFNQSGQYAVNVRVFSGNDVFSDKTDYIYVAPAVNIKPDKVLTPDRVVPGADKKINIGIQLTGSAPLVVLSAQTNRSGDKLNIAFTKGISDPAGKNGQFSIMVNGVANSATAISLNETDNKIIELTLQSPIFAGQTIFLNYTAGDIQSTDGEQLAGFNNYAVMNKVAALIYNGDGFGFSGIMSGTPLGDDVSMTGYGAWPSGFSKGSDAFIGGVFDGQNIWMVPGNADRIIKVNKATGVMTGYNNWPAGFTKGSWAFYGGVFDGQNIWMIPGYADRIVKVDKDTGAMTGYNNWPAGFTKKDYAFYGGVFDGQSIWMVPANADRIIKIDKDTGVMTGYSNWPAGFTKGANAFVGGVFDGQNIWLIPMDADRIIKIDKDTGVMTGYSNWPNGFTKGSIAFAGGVFDGQNIWIVPFSADRIIKIDKDTGVMTGYNNWPSGFTKGSSAFVGGVFDSKDIWLVPFNANTVVKINKTSGVMSGYNNWPVGFAKGGSAFVGGVFDGENICMIPYNASIPLVIKPDSSDLSVTANLTADDAFSFYISQDESLDGNLIGLDNWWPTTHLMSASLVPGKTNYLHIVAKDLYGGIAGFIGEFTLHNQNFSFANGTQKLMTSVDNWVVYTDKFGGTKGVITSMGKYGWGGITLDAEWIWTNNGYDFTTRYFSTPVYYSSPVPTLRSIRVIDTIPGANIDIDQTSFSKTPYSITVGADATIIEWHYDNIPSGQTENISFDVVLKNPVAGENRLVNQKLEVLYMDINGNEIRTELPSYYVHVLESAFDGTVATNKPVCQANEDVLINANITSKSGYARTIDAKVLIEDSQGVLVAQAADLTGLNFAAGETKTLNNIIFNTGTILAGNYRVHLILYDNREKAGEASANFIIQQPAGSTSVSSTVTTDKISYNANEAVTMTTAVQNASANVILNNLTARITLSNAGGTVLYTEDKSVATLVPGQLIQIKSYWNTAGNPQGRYSVKIEVLDGVNLLSTSTASFTITGSGVSIAGLQGSLSATPTPVYQGKDVSVGYVVTNSGNEDIPLLKIKILIVDPVTQTVKAEITDQQPIAKDSSITGIGLINLSTTTMIPGIYIAVLQAATDAMPEYKTLFKANFEVKAGLEISKTITGAGNLLVWINKKCQKPKDDSNEHSGKCNNGGNGHDGDHDNNHHQDHHCMRVDLLKKILDNAAVGYSIVYDKDDFQRQLRNSYFTDYVILGDDEPLEGHFGDELRELVYSGKGFISSLFLTHGKPNTPFTGIEFKGYLPSNRQTVELMDGPLATDSTFAVDGKTVRTEVLTGATVAGWLPPAGHDHHWYKNIHHYQRCHAEHNPAIVLNNYGQGKSVYFAFDIGETLDDGNYEQLAALLKNTIIYVHKPTDANGTFLPNQLVPSEVAIKSLGGVFDLKIKETYPQVLKIYDPVSKQWITDNPWLQDLHVESDATYYFRYYVLTPETPGAYLLQTEIDYVQNGTAQLYKTFNAEIVVDNGSTALEDRIIAALKALSVTRRDKNGVCEAIKYIERVKYRGSRSQKACDDNIHDILEAVEAIMSITSCDAKPVRLMMDMLLQICQGKYYFR